MTELQKQAAKNLNKSRNAFLKAVHVFNIADDSDEVMTPVVGTHLEVLYNKMELAHADLIGAEFLARQVGVFKVK